MSICKLLIACFNTFTHIVGSNTYLNAVMHLKLLLNCLLVFLVSIPHHTILAQDNATIKLNELMKNPEWGSLKKEKIIDDGKEITMLEIMNAFGNQNIISETSNESLMRHLTIVLSCDQSKFVRQYIVLVLAAILECRVIKVVGNHFNCVNLLLENIKNIDSMITQMLNILTYFYQLSPTSTDFKQFYNALMALKLYSEYETNTFMESNFLEALSKPNEIKIEMKFQEIEKKMFSINHQLQMFAAMYCLPIPIQLRQNEIISQKKPSFKLMQNTMKELVNTYNERFVALGFEHLDLYNNDAINADLDTIWRLLDQQQPGGHKTRILWLGEPKEVKAVVHEVASQYGTKKLATFQKLTLKSIAQMFYKIILVTVQTSFSDTKNKVDEGLCPLNFFTTLRKNWVELKNDHFPAIREACLSIRHFKPVEECQESFYKSLNGIWLNFIDIKRTAIAVACSKVTSPHKENLRQCGRLFSFRFKQLLQSINLLIFRPTALTKAEFWDSLKNELIKFRSLDWPAEIAETLETLTFYLENEQNNVNPEEVIGLLELEMKTSSADFGDKEVSIDIENPLEIVSNFTEVVMELRKSINNVNYSNVMLFNAFDFEETISIEPDNELDDIALNKVCKLSTNVLKLFDLIVRIINFHDHEKIQIRKFVIRRSVFAVDELYKKLPKLLQSMLYHLSKAPRAENINLRSAIFLMYMYKAWIIQAMGKQEIQVLWQPNQLKRLTLLIMSQLEIYVVQNCGVNNYIKTVINAQTYDMYGLFATETIKQIFDSIDSGINVTQDTFMPLFVNKPEVSLSKVSIERLVDGDFSPLDCIDELKFQWDGTSKSIQTIRTEVVPSMNPNKFVMYQTLVQNSGTSIVLGYILNILLDVGQQKVNFKDHHIASVLLKIEQFESTVYPSSKVDSPRTVFNGFIWCIKQHKISYVRANILKNKIERKIESYGMNITDYYGVMKANKIIRENASGNVQKTYIEPLELFVDCWVDMFDHDFYCVANYMKMII